MMRGARGVILLSLCLCVAVAGVSPVVISVAQAATSPTVAYHGGDLQALTPTRVLDTRVGLGAPRARVGPGQRIDLVVTGAGGVPSAGVGSVALNVTAAGPSAASFVTVWPGGAPRPLASSLNLTPGRGRGEPRPGQGRSWRGGLAFQQRGLRGSRRRCDGMVPGVPGGSAPASCPDP